MDTRDQIEKQQQREALADKLRIKKHARQLKEKDIPAELMEPYNAMRAQVPDAVVPVQDFCCGACFYQISQSDYLALQKQKLLQCKNCYRFLYLPELVPTIADTE